MRHPRWWTVGLAVTVITACWGCGDQPPPVSSSTEEATVKGTVTIRGKPATKGMVVFDPANYQRKDVTERSAPIAKDGTYMIKTLVGDNMVHVSGPEAEKASAAYTNIDFDVQPGENTLDIKLPPEP